MEPGAIAVARGHRRMGSLAITAVVVGVTLLILAMVVFSSRGGSAPPTTTRPATAALAEVSHADAIDSARLRTALSWVEGLAAGQILPTDVTNRLGVQEPRTARIVMAAWSDLNSYGGSTRLRTALSWVEGLAAGQILPTDVTNRLGVQEPRTARIVMAAWSDLNPVLT